MSDRITEEFAGPLILPTAEIPLLDGAVPLVRDEPWEWFVVFEDGPGVPSDLTGKTVAAELRWQTGEQAVTAAPVEGAAGQVRLSLAAEATAAMPFGQLLNLYISIDNDTEGVVPVVVLEGYAT